MSLQRSFSHGSGFQPLKPPSHPTHPGGPPPRTTAAAGDQKWQGRIDSKGGPFTTTESEINQTTKQQSYSHAWFDQQSYNWERNLTSNINAWLYMVADGCCARPMGSLVCCLVCCWSLRLMGCFHKKSPPSPNQRLCNPRLRFTTSHESHIT